MNIPTVIIPNWKQYGDYMVFAKVNDEYHLNLLLVTEADKITAIGSPVKLNEFKKALKLKKIAFIDSET